MRSVSQIYTVVRQYIAADDIYCSYGWYPHLMFPCSWYSAIVWYRFEAILLTCFYGGELETVNRKRWVSCTTLGRCSERTWNSPKYTRPHSSGWQATWNFARCCSYYTSFIHIYWGNTIHKINIKINKTSIQSAFTWLRRRWRFYKRSDRQNDADVGQQDMSVVNAEAD